MLADEGSLTEYLQFSENLWQLNETNIRKNSMTRW